MTVFRDQNAGRIHSMKKDNIPIQSVDSSNIWEQRYQVKILFRKKLRAD